MILLPLIATLCIVNPVFLESDTVLRKKLIRRKKQHEWVSDESSATPRHISPVKKIFKRKIIKTNNSDQQKIVHKIPHISPVYQNNVVQHFNQTLPSVQNQEIPHKPMDAKRCEFEVIIENLFVLFLSPLSSLSTLFCIDET